MSFEHTQNLGFAKYPSDLSVVVYACGSGILTIRVQIVDMSSEARCKIQSQHKIKIDQVVIVKRRRILLFMVNIYRLNV